MVTETHPRHLFERVVKLLKGGARDEAESLCREAVRQDPGDVNFIALLGTILADINKLEEAEQLLGRAVKAAPGHARAHEDLGAVLLNLGRPGEALSHLQKASELTPNNA